MDSMDQQVIAQLRDWLQAGKRCWLCTIVKTFGSSPRPVGSLLACNEDGLYSGSLSGGCVEDDLRESIVRGELARNKPERLSYGVAVEDVQRLGLPCGGTLQVVVEAIDPEQAALYTDLATKIARRTLVERRVDLDTGATGIREVESYRPLRVEDNSLQQVYGPSFQLLLIGAVQVAYYLCEMARALDYEVAVCDPRPELIDNFRVRDIELSAAMPDDWLREKTVDQRTAVVALCHDPRIDDMALMEVLHRDAFYIGAMGSENTSAQRRQRLQNLDLSARELDKLHAPVGLSIGSKTPPEIAIAILAELTRLRADEKRAAHSHARAS